MDQAASDHVLALRVLHAGSIIMTHAVGSGSGAFGAWLCTILHTNLRELLFHALYG
jgi:hypothetical protein